MLGTVPALGAAARRRGAFWRATNGRPYVFEWEENMKRWFLENFLPFWAKETVLQDNRELRRQIRQLRQENAVLLSYIKGLEKGMRTRSVGLGRGMTTPQSGIRDSRQLP